MKRLRKPGFTLVELVLATAVFVVVIAYATTTLSSVVTMQLTQRRYQSLSLQTQKALDLLSSEVRTAPYDKDSVRIVQYPGSTRHGFNDDTALLVDGQDRSLYCVEKVTVSGVQIGRLVRFTIDPSIVVRPSITTCAVSSFIRKDYLTDDQTDVASFRAIAEGANAITVDSDQGIPGVSLELVTRYAPGEARARQAIPQVALKALAERDLRK